MTERTKTILMLEDNEDDFFFFQRGLKSSGFCGVLRRVGDGEEAVKYLMGEGPYSERAEHPMPDIIVCDIKMPRMGGFEFVSWMKADARLSAIPIAMLSSSGVAEDLERAKALRVNRYA